MKLLSWTIPLYSWLVLQGNSVRFPISNKVIIKGMFTAKSWIIFPIKTSFQWILMCCFIKRFITSLPVKMYMLLCFFFKHILDGVLYCKPEADVFTITIKIYVILPIITFLFAEVGKWIIFNSILKLLNYFNSVLDLKYSQYLIILVHTQLWFI